MRGTGGLDAKSRALARLFTYKLFSQSFHLAREDQGCQSNRQEAV